MKKKSQEQTKKKPTKVDKIKERKAKEKEMAIIMSALKQNQVSEELINQFSSIKNSTSDTTQNKLKQVKVPKQKYPIDELAIEQQEIIKPIEKSQQQIPTSVNIFKTAVFEQEVKKDMVKVILQDSTLTESQILESTARRLMPDINLESFDGKRNQDNFNKLKVEQQETIDILNDDIYDLDPRFYISEDKQLKHCQRKLYPIERTEEQEQARKKLPIFFKETEIIDTVNCNLVTIVSGETGCGKSTQIPQMLLEAGFAQDGIIAVTQPRRLPTISLAKRVAKECNFSIGIEVTYQVRHEASQITSQQKIKFMTDGILLNEMSSSPLLLQYSIIIIDEAHERKVNTDILIGILSKIVLIRAKSKYQPLRLVIMSATLRIEDFISNKNLFPRGVNVIHIESRQFPVTVYFNKKTKDDYVEEAINKCLKIHERLPPGDILIFLTGQKEIKDCCQLLQEKLQQNQYKCKGDDYLSDDNSNYKIESSEIEQEKLEEEQQVGDNQIIEEELEEEELLKKDEDIYDKDDINELKEIGKTNQKMKLGSSREGISGFVIYPLYSKLDFNYQERVFSNQDWQTKRMIVVSTNVAETSLTIPTIRYVIDAGKFKKKVVDSKIGLSKHYIQWISQAAASQRSGRAGRTGPGYCYRLYSSAVFVNQMSKFNSVEILETPLQSVMLSLKNIGVQNVYDFPFLSMPDKDNINEAMEDLRFLQAIQNSKENVEKYQDLTIITDLGRILAAIPLLPKYSKMLLAARAEKVLGYGLLLVCVLTTEEIIKYDSFKSTNQQIQYFDQQEINLDEDEVVQNFKKQINEIEKETTLHKQKLLEQKDRFKCIRQFLKQKCSSDCESDLIVLMNITGEFFQNMILKSYNKEINNVDQLILSYCNDNNFLFHSMKEIYYNLLQLIDILQMIITDKKELEDINLLYKNYRYPNQQESKKLINILIESFKFNQICRIQQSYDPERNTYTKYYQSQLTQDKQYIHPASILSGQQKPYVLYSQILEIGNFSKSYLYNVTTINDLQILFKLDQRSDEQKKLTYDEERSWYDKGSDQIYSLANAVVGNGWELQNFKYPLNNKYLGFYKIFAQLLLKGEILDFFKSTQKLYKYSISSIKETNMQNYSQAIIIALRNSQIINRKILLNTWKKNPTFLLNEFLLFTNQQYHQNLKQKWPPQQ